MEEFEEKSNDTLDANDLIEEKEEHLKVKKKIDWKSFILGLLAGLFVLILIIMLGA